MMQQGCVEVLRRLGHEVYDFKKPNGEKGFSWTDIDPDWSDKPLGKRWTNEQYIENLKTPAAELGFKRDMDALRNCDAVVLVLPCGRSAHTEAGWACGAGIPVVVLLEPNLVHINGREDIMPTQMAGDPELMYKMYDSIAADFDSMLNRVEYLESRLLAK